MKIGWRCLISFVMSFLIIFGSAGAAVFAHEAGDEDMDAALANENEWSSNLVLNGGFEEPLQAGNIPGWAINGGEIRPGITVEVTDEISYAGDYSIYIEDAADDEAVVVHTEAIPIEAGQTYELVLQANETSGTAYVGLRYYATASASVVSGYVGTEYVKLSEEDEWTEVKLEARAPAEANFARVLLYTTRASTGKMYIDDVTLTLQEEDDYADIEYELENLGSQVHTLNTHRAAFGRDEAGRLVGYSTMVGIPAKLLVIDIENDELVKQIPIEDTVEGRTYAMEYVRGLVVQPDGTVYMAGTPSYMFKYVPGDDRVEYIANLPGRQVFDMTAGPDGILIGGTYNQSEAFEYNTATGVITSLGRIMENESYAYSVAYDAKRDVTYFGIGSHAHLIRYDRKTGEKTNIPLPVSANFVFDLTVSGDKLFMRFSPGNAIAMDLETLEFDENDQYITSRLMSQPSPVDGKIYYTSRDTLGYYDPDTATYHSLGHHTDGNAYAYSFEQLEDPRLPGYTLVGITRYARVFKYNLETGYFQFRILDIEGEPTELQTVTVGEDGKVHTSGYLTGGNAIYDPATNETVEFTDLTLALGQQLPQTDRIFTHKGKVYYATYPNANIYVFDPAKPWNRTGSDPNPRLLFTVNDVGNQDRARGMVIPEKDLLVIGTVPKYGHNGGAFVLYDLANDEREAYYNIVPDQSITAMAYKDGLIYVGSNIWGGLGQEPEAEEAVLFIWDIENKEKIFETVPVPGKTGITELIVGPDGNIWGSAEGDLFIFDPDAREVVHAQQLVNRSYNGAVWRDAQFEVGTDGNVYGVQAGRFFVIDAETKEMKVIRNEGIRNWMAQDEYGRFYLTEGADLLRLTIPHLLAEPVTLESLSAKTDQHADDGKIGTPLAAQLRNSLRQAKHHLDQGDIAQAIFFAEKFAMHLNQEAMAKFIDADVKAELNRDIQKLINKLSH